MQSLDRNGYTADQVKKALHSSSRVMAFHYDLLDSQNTLKRQLDNVLAASVANNTFADIKRTARFTVRDDGSINFLSDRIKPWARLRMPDGGCAEWPLGVFILSTPPRKTDSAGVVTREVEAYDLLQVLVYDKVEDRYVITAGTNYIAAVKAVLDTAGLTAQNLTATDKTLPADRDWPPGTTKLNIVNDLLGAVNYRSLSFDENGLAVAQTYVSPQVRASEYTYKDDDESVIFPEVEQGLDLFAVPNKWVLVVSEPDRDPMMSSYINTNPDSPTSTVNRSRTIVDYQEMMEAADQASLDAKVQRLAFEASQVYEQVDFGTAIMPFHSDGDVLTLEFTALGISAKYSETAWSFELEAGARMKHTIRRVILI
ncbi:hypothetical protein JCM15765_14650 [Paradesulfitobacterium aromaticivorans]